MRIEMIAQPTHRAGGSAVSDALEKPFLRSEGRHGGFEPESRERLRFPAAQIGEAAAVHPRHLCSLGLLVG